MAETYCGKSCADCTQKEESSCPGCRTGPGALIAGNCELARCVRDKGHETCATCLNRMSCGIFQRRERMPERRMKAQRIQEERQKALEARVPILARWLWPLFWLLIPNLIAGILTQDLIHEKLPGLYTAGAVLSFLVSLAHGLILLKLSPAEEGYRVAGLCFLASAVVEALLDPITSSLWSLIFLIPMVGISLYGEYREMTAHSTVLTGVDNQLALKWEKLWYWTLGTYAGLIVSILVLFLIPLLGTLTVLAVLIVLIVVGILKLVYLYQTAKLFREFPLPAQPI